MSSTRAIIDHLFDALALAGHGAIVDRYRLEFTARGFATLTSEDIARVSRCIADPAACDARPPEPAPAVLEAEPAFDIVERWSPFVDFGVFVDGIRNGRALLEAINRLAMAEGLDDAIEAARALFADILGYDRGRHDETARLREQKTIERLVRVGRFGEFVVSLAATAYGHPYATVCGPVFRLHPYGLVVWVVPERRMVRFVYRDGVDRPYGMRTLAGGRTGHEPHDNLVLWTARLAALEPRPADTPAGLVDRGRVALSAEPHVIWGRRPSAPVPADRPVPGIPWARVWQRGFEAFVQGRSAPPRWCWGLARVLRERFPMFVEEGAGRLLLTDWRFVEPRAHDAPVRVGLSLTLDVQGSREGIEVEASLPRFDESGGWTSRGQRWRLVPRVREGGRLFNRPADIEAPLDENALLDVQWPGGGDDEREDDEPEGEIEPRDADIDALDASPPVGDEVETDADAAEGGATEADEAAASEGDEFEFDGADLCTLLEIAVGRKLGALARRVWRAPASRAALHDALMDLCDADGTLHLASGRYLRAAMTPVPLCDALPLLVTDPRLEPTPPAWACPDLSADLPLGRWYPVTGARLGPAGGLAVPLLDDAGQVTLQVCERPSPEVNPRCGGDGGTAPAHWIAAPLRRWCALPAGRLRHPARLVGRDRVELDASMLVRPGPRLVLRVDAATRMRWPGAAERVVVVDVPAAELAVGPVRDAPPALRVEPGARVTGGEVWLTALRALWGERRPSIHAGVNGRVRGLLDAVFALHAQTAASRTSPWREDIARVAFRLPPDVTGVVIAAEVVERRARRGDLRGWRARVVVRPATAVRDLVAWLPDGRAVDVEIAPPGEFPPAVGEAEAPRFILEDDALPRPEPDPWRLSDDPWSDGRIRRETLTLVRLERIARSGGHGPRRWRDGLWLPASGSEAAIGDDRRRRWALRAPTDAEALDAHVRRHAGGVPAHVPALLDALTMARVDPAHFDGAAAGIRYADEWGPRIGGTRALVRLENAIEGHRVDWSCRCGAVSGPHRAMEPCGRLGEDGPGAAATSASGCNTRALPVLRAPDAWPLMTLVEQIPHPWRREAIGALLGLTADELRAHFVHLGGDLLTQLVRAAWAQPLAAARRRLEADPPRDVRRAIERGAVDLKRLIERGVSRQDLALRWLPVPSERLAPDGYRPGAPDLVRAPLTWRYRCVLNANARLKALRAREGVPAHLVPCARRSLIDRVDDWFGDPDRPGRGEPSDLASSIRRVWPLGRASRPRSAIPGLMTLTGARLAAEGERGVPERCAIDPFASAARVARAAQIENAARPADEPPSEVEVEVDVELEVVTDAAAGRQAVVALAPGEVFVEPLDRPAPRRTGEDWQRAADHARFWDEVAEPLAIVLGAMTWSEAVGPGVASWPTVDDVLRRGPGEEGSPIGRLITAPLFRRLDAPGPLTSALTRDVPLWLPADPREARSRLAPMVEAAFPGDDPVSAWGRALLVGVLTGWTRRRQTDLGDPRWVWHPPLGAPRSRRGLPPFGHRAWRGWPGAAAVLEPVRWFALGGGWNPAVRALAGYDRPPLPPVDDAWQPGERASEAMSAPAAPDPVPEPPAPAAAVPEARPPPAEIRPLATSLAVWFAAPSAPSSTEVP